MANNITTHPRLWSLDTVAAIKAAGNTILVRGIHYEPTNVGDVLALGEYGPDGSTVQNLVRLKAHPSVAALPIDVVYEECLEFNGMYLATITAGTVYLLIESVDPA